MATSAWITSAVKELYGAKPRPIPELTAAVHDALGLPELAGPKKAASDVPGLTTLATTISRGVTTGLGAIMDDIAKSIPTRRAELDKRVGSQLAERLWLFGDLSRDAWEVWLGNLAFADLTKNNIASAKPALDALNDGLVASISAYAAQHLSVDAIAAMQGPVLDSIKKSVEKRATWLSKPDDLDAVIDLALTEAKIPYKDHNDPAWKEARGKATDMVVVAETDLLKGSLHKSHTTKTTPEVWGRVRSMYVGTIDKPMWRYYAEDIVNFTAFGKSFDKSGGINKAVAPALERVEASAKRLAGGKYIAPDLRESNGFRFQPEQGDFRKPHVSFHATGQAVDFDGDHHNLLVSAKAKSLVGQLGGADFAQSETLENTQELSKLGTELDQRMAYKKGLQEQLKDTSLSEDDRTDVQSKLAAVTAELDSSPDRPDVKQLRDRASRIYDEVIKAQDAFRAAWSELTASGKAADVDVSKLVARLTDMRTKLQTRLDALSAKITKLQDEITTLKSVSTKTKGQPPPDAAAAADAKTRLEQAGKDLSPLEAEAAGLRLRLKELDPVLQAVGGKGSKELLTEVQQKVFDAGGLTNLPKWMVLAFVENGFTWGGGWHGRSDAMHFSYLGAVPGVTQSGF